MSSRRHIWRYDAQNQLVAMGEEVDGRVTWSYTRDPDPPGGASPTPHVTCKVDPTGALIRTDAEETVPPIRDDPNSCQIEEEQENTG